LSSTARASAKPKRTCGPEPPTWPKAQEPSPPEAEGELCCSSRSLSLSLLFPLFFFVEKDEEEEPESESEGAKTVSSTMNV